MEQLTMEMVAVHAERLRPAMIAHARKRMGQDAEDVVAETVAAALASCSAFHTEVTGTTVARWMYTILQRRIAQRYRERYREAKYLPPEPPEPEEVEAAHARQDRILKPSGELLEEARLRLRHAALTEREADCLNHLLEGVTLRNSASELGITFAMVRYYREQAIRKLRGCNLDVVPNSELGAEPWNYRTTDRTYRATSAAGVDAAKARGSRVR